MIQIEALSGECTTQTPFYFHGNAIIVGLFCIATCRKYGKPTKKVVHSIKIKPETYLFLMIFDY
jgi:hypothetical protein